MDWRYPLANNDDLGGEFNSRMAEEPSLDFRCWQPLTLCSGTWSIGAESVAKGWVSDSQFWWKKFSLCRETENVTTSQVVLSLEGRMEFLGVHAGQRYEKASYRTGGTYRHWFCRRPYYNVVLRLLWRLSRSSWRRHNGIICVRQRRLLLSLLLLEFVESRCDP